MKYLSILLAAAMLYSTAAETPTKKKKAGKSAPLPELIHRSNGIYSAMEAAAAGDTDTLKARIQENAHINQADEFGNTPLHLAARNNAVSCIQLLLKAGADPMQKDADGNTASQLATSKKAISALKAAMRHRTSEIELCREITGGNMDAIKKAIGKKGFNPNMLSEDNSNSILMLACARGHAASVKALIKAGANVNYKAKDSRSVLHKAIEADNAEIITILLKAGADPMVQSNNRAYPIHDAVWSRKLNSVSALLPAYKHINYSPDGAHNGTPIGLAINRGFTNVVKLFIDAGIDLNASNTGNPPLITAAQSGHREIVEMLIKAGADKKATNRAGKTALDVAKESVRHLL